MFRSAFWKGYFPNSHLFPAYWILMGIIILLGDYVAGPTIQFPIFYLIPVSLASWYSGFGWGLTFAITLPLIRLYYYYYFVSWPVPLTLFDAWINTVIRIAVLAGAAFLVSRNARQTQELAERVHILEGFLPICSFCKKIRDQNNVWQPLEGFISDRSKAQFTHGLCPDCGKTHYGEFIKQE